MHLPYESQNPFFQEVIVDLDLFIKHVNLTAYVSLSVFLPTAIVVAGR